MINSIAIAGYRSLRDVRLGLERLTVITGANGSGKSNLYRALLLLSEIAQGRIIRTLAAEGGLPSTLWAGPETLSRGMREGLQPIQGTRRSGPVSLKLGFASDDYGYAIDLGLPAPIPSSQFSWDPEIKAEALWVGASLGRNNVIAERRGPGVRIRGESGEWRQASTAQASVDSMMTHCADMRDGLELLILRERMRSWRFYDQLRTDRESPSRRAQIGTFTPVLASNGADLAAAVQTILEIGDDNGLAETIEDAFPGATLSIEVQDGLFELLMHQSGMLRPLKVRELSDGTLRYILLTAALLTPRPPELMILNEPESSLHPDLLLPLARLIVRASSQSQIVVVSHASDLVDAISAEGACKLVRLDKRLGETVVDDEEPVSWTWPVR